MAGDQARRSGNLNQECLRRDGESGTVEACTGGIMERALGSPDREGRTGRLLIRVMAQLRFFTYQFMIMKISTKITNMQITTPIVSTKTRTASVSGRLALFICNSREKNT